VIILDDGVILDLAGYTLWAVAGAFLPFGIFTRRALPDNWTIYCVVPARAGRFAGVVSRHAAEWFGGYQDRIERCY